MFILFCNFLRFFLAPGQVIGYPDISRLVSSIVICHQFCAKCCRSPGGREIRTNETLIGQVMIRGTDHQLPALIVDS